jgi:uncharacterized protein YchJ
MTKQAKNLDETPASEQREKRHWWEQCPCGSGVRFGQCCGKSSDTCRYERTEESIGRQS